MSASTSGASGASAGGTSTGGQSMTREEIQRYINIIIERFKEFQKAKEDRDYENAIVALDGVISAMTFVSSAGNFRQTSIDSAASLIRILYETRQGMTNLASQTPLLRLDFKIPTLQELNKKIQDQVDKLADKSGADDDKWQLVEPQDIKWSRDDVVGQDAVFRSFATTMMSEDNINVMFYGPPGTGKTMITQALAREENIPLINVQMSDIMSNVFGGTEKNIKSLMSFARSKRQEYGRVMIFMDEIEFLVAARGQGNPNLGSIVNEFLQTLDGATSDMKNIVFVCATNLPSSVDPAFLRRMQQIYIGLPNRSQRQILFNKFMENVQQEFSPEQINTVVARPRMSPSNYSQMFKMAKNISLTSVIDLPSDWAENQVVMHDLRKRKRALVRGTGQSPIERRKTEFTTTADIATNPLNDGDLKQAFENVLPNTTYEQEMMLFNYAGITDAPEV